jgi:hypothetical protein
MQPSPIPQSRWSHSTSGLSGADFCLVVSASLSLDFPLSINDRGGSVRPPLPVRQVGDCPTKPAQA